jgi:hypothetical protein
MVLSSLDENESCLTNGCIQYNSPVLEFIQTSVVVLRLFHRCREAGGLIKLNRKLSLQMHLKKCMNNSQLNNQEFVSVLHCFVCVE